MPKKKQRTQQRNEEESDEGNSSSNEMDTADFSEQIQVDFEARSPEDVDFDSIKLLLNQKLGQLAINLGELSEIVIQQSNIGNVIYQAVDEEPVIVSSDAAAATDSNANEDDTIFGLISLINLRKYKQKDCVKQLTSYLNKEFEKLKKLDAKTKDFVQKNVFEAYKIGYLVNERYINIPSEISVPMFESLLSDLKKTSDDEEGPASSAASSSKMSKDGDVDYFMILSKSFEPDSGSSKERDYANGEEEVLKEFSDYIVEIKYPKIKDNPFNYFLEVLFLTSEKLNQGLAKIKNLVK